MAMTAAQRRKLDRERKAAARAEKAAAGAPARIEQVYAAIVDANRFAMKAADKRVWITNVGWAPINSAVIIAVAVDILALRYGHDVERAREAVLAALEPNPSHRSSTNIPSLRPDPGMPRYNTAAPDAAFVHPTVPDTPVTPSRPVDA